MQEGVLRTGMYTTSSIITGVTTSLFVMGLKHSPLSLMTILLAEDTFLVYLTLYVKTALYAFGTTTNGM
jgi:hypothetical protein